MLRVTTSGGDRRSGRWASPTLLTYPRYRSRTGGRAETWSGGRHYGLGHGNSSSAAAGDRAARAGLSSYLFGLSITLVLAVTLSWSYSTTARLGYRIESLKREVASLETVQDKLTYELSSLQSMARVEKEAAERLGLARPEYVRATAGRSADPASEGTPAASGSVARLIYLGEGSGDGVSGATAAGEAAAGEESLVRQLWNRLFRWLTGASKAEARTRD